MSEQRIDVGAEAATRTDADAGEGQGVQTATGTPTDTPGGAVGGSGDQPVPYDERADADEAVDGATEGERSIRAAEANRPD